MRRLSSLAVLIVVACATTPPPTKKSETAPAPAPDAPFAITDLTVPTQYLLGATLRLEGKLNGVSARELKWTAKIGDQTAGEGTDTIEPSPDGTFTTDLPIKIGNALDDLTKYQVADTIEVLVSAKLGSNSGEHAATLRTPQLPTVVVQTVQAQKTGPANIAIGYFVSIKNPNLFDLQMSGFNYKCVVGDKTINTTTLPGSVLPAASGTEFEISGLEANAGNCGKDINKLIKQPTLGWALTGTIDIESAAVPFNLTGTMKLSAG